MKIEIRNVTKVIKKTKVIDNVDITFEGGKIYGLSVPSFISYFNSLRVFIHYHPLRSFHPSYI